MNDVIVLGGGMVGKVMALELSKTYDTTLVDNNLAIAADLPGQIHFIQADLRNENKIAALVKDYRLAIGAVPGFMGFELFKNVIHSKTPIVDISFFPEDALELRELAKEQAVFACFDCGIAPGFSNMILGYEQSIAPINKFKCMVGGLPMERIKPFEYKAPFSPVDVIEEYTRPARIIRNGATIEVEALSEIEQIETQKWGILEAFLSDGLRSILYTMPIKDMEEKTLRYPGHAQSMKLLRDYGFFSDQNLPNQNLSPRKMTEEILFKHWKLSPTDDEMTFMRIILERELDTKVYEIYDRRDKESGFSSMSRTTGFTATALASMYLEGEISSIGLYAPEELAQDERIFFYVKEYLQERGISIQQSVQ